MCAYKANNITPSIDCYRVGAVAELELHRVNFGHGCSLQLPRLFLFLGVSVACFHYSMLGCWTWCNISPSNKKDPKA